MSHNLIDPSEKQVVLNLLEAEPRHRLPLWDLRRQVARDTHSAETRATRIINSLCGLDDAPLLKVGHGRATEVWQRSAYEAANRLSIAKHRLQQAVIAEAAQRGITLWPYGPYGVALEADAMAHLLGMSS